MSKSLSVPETVALGAMTLALFLGAGNIIFPPLVGMQAGAHATMAGAGFLVTAVLFPVLAIISLAINKGDIAELTKPLGKQVSTLFISTCFLTLGVLFATPRTATISYEVITNDVHDSFAHKLMFSLIFFGGVGAVLIKSGRLLEIVGFFLSPIKIGALIFIGLFAWIHPVGNLTTAVSTYNNNAFGTGFINGYQTLDVISALCFGAIITHTLQQRGVVSGKGILRYSALAALIAAFGLSIIYICFISMGSHSNYHAATNGMQIMSDYVQTVFGVFGRTLLATIITLACLVTAIGLTTGTARYFHQTTRLSYGVLVTLTLVFSAAISVLGLDVLTKLAVPVLSAIYPAALIVVALGIIKRWINIPDRVYRALFYLALIVGTVSFF
ncbi:branched-chain amino acid transport system II carrier protein [Escherichia coli]|nr:branched-chain amino acid transport system II carrier protein [Escherichia coli]